MELFATKDPRGFIVSCSVECWNNHLYYHQDIGGFENEALRAIQEPVHGFIYSSNHMPDRAIYYRKIRGRTAEIKVVVEFNDKNVGIVLSICFVSNRPKGELLIWPK